MASKKIGRKKVNKSGGSAAGGGVNYQASAMAYVGTHIIARQELGWLFDSLRDWPSAVGVVNCTPVIGHSG